MQEQELVFQDINEFRRLIQCPTLIINDFNQVTHFSDRIGHIRDDTRIQKFN